MPKKKLDYLAFYPSYVGMLIELLGISFKFVGQFVITFLAEKEIMEWEVSLVTNSGILNFGDTC